MSDLKSPENHSVSGKAGDENKLTPKSSSSCVGTRSWYHGNRAMIFHSGPNNCSSFYAIRLGEEIIKGQKEKEQESPGASKPCGKGETGLRLVREVLGYR